jgi:hypothetical protein
MSAWPDMHPDFYPATQTVHWEPLKRVVPQFVGEFMFMQADVGGRFYYKHKDTRGYVILDDSLNAYDARGRKMSALRAVAAARSGLGRDGK